MAKLLRLLVLLRLSIACLSEASSHECSPLGEPERKREETREGERETERGRDRQTETEKERVRGWAGRDRDNKRELRTN